MLFCTIWREGELLEEKNWILQLGKGCQDPVGEATAMGIFAKSACEWLSPYANLFWGFAKGLRRTFAKEACEGLAWN